ncbi:hypothetical protein P0L94_14500 [Microbacter sp. GSS18]|nr:hypothetical protein P0L94_14500 [Microbacter sp. GSS18]
MTAVAASAPRIVSAPLPMMRRALVDGWRGLLGWIIGIAAVVSVYVPLFPTMASPELAGMLDSLPPELVNTLNYGDITSGAGYVQATFFGLTGFALLSIACIGWGSSLTGGAEESGRLELTLGHGVGRVQYALETAGVLLVRVIVIGAVGYGMVWLYDAPAELELDAGNLLAATVAWMGLGMLTAAASFVVGTSTGRRAWAVGAGSAVAIVGFVMQAVANNSEDLDWLHRFSPYDWAFYANPLVDGYDWGGLGLLWGGSVLLIAAGTFALSRRDILG